MKEKTNPKRPDIPGVEMNMGTWESSVDTPHPAPALENGTQINKTRWEPAWGLPQVRRCLPPVRKADFSSSLAWKV